MLKTPKITAGQRSKIERYKHLKIKNIIIEMIEWVIENEIYGEPYVGWVSVEQIIWGAGMHWKEEKCPKRLQLGIRQHLKIRKASQFERKKWKRNTGWEVPPFPPELYRAIKNTVKDAVINEIIKENNYPKVTPFWAQGYLDPDTDPPTLHPQYAHDVVGWFFYLEEPDVFEFITEWLDSLGGKNKSIRYQWVYNKKMFGQMIRKQIAGATAKLELLDQIQERFKSHKKITPYIDPKHITWDDEEE